MLTIKNYHKLRLTGSYIYKSIFVNDVDVSDGYYHFDVEYENVRQTVRISRNPTENRLRVVLDNKVAGWILSSDLRTTDTTLGTLSKICKGDN